MKRVISIAFIAAIILSACGDENPTAKIEQQIKQKTSEVNKLQKEIKELKAQLPESIESSSSIAVATKTMQGEVFNHYITVFASVQADEYAFISPEIGGQIKSIHVEEGQRVNKGDLLVSVNTEATANQIKQIKTNLELATKTFEKQETLWKQNIGSEIQYLQAKTQKESLEAQLATLNSQKRMNEVRAPFSGYVNKIYQKVGELASQAMPLVEMVDLSKLDIIANIPEQYISVIKVGQSVEVTFDALPDIMRTPKIQRISNVIKPQSRTFEVEVYLQNPKELIKPNMISTIRINDYHQEDAFVVPSLIIKQDITGKYIYIAEEKEGKTIAKKVYIETGYSYNENTTITKGLTKGDKVIVEGYSQVSNGSKVLEK